MHEDTCTTYVSGYTDDDDDDKYMLSLHLGKLNIFVFSISFDIAASLFFAVHVCLINYTDETYATTILLASLSLYKAPLVLSLIHI